MNRLIHSAPNTYDEIKLLSNKSEGENMNLSVSEANNIADPVTDYQLFCYSIKESVFIRPSTSSNNDCSDDCYDRTVSLCHQLINLTEKINQLEKRLPGAQY